MGGRWEDRDEFNALATRYEQEKEMEVNSELHAAHREVLALDELVLGPQFHLCMRWAEKSEQVI